MFSFEPLPTKFFLGTHEVSWLEKVQVPLFISARRLRKIKAKFPKAITTWALDSGGFSEISMYGAWKTTPEQYVAEVRKWSQAIGGMEWAAIQDWMVEPHMLAITGKKVADHQRLTVESYLKLRELAPEINWTPVIQGWTWGDYEDCVRLYEANGVDLFKLPLVGIGSVCRRQNTMRASMIIKDFASQGMKLHGFGFKKEGLESCWGALASADSLAWSDSAVHNPPRWECRGKHKHCNNCPEYALEWLEDMYAKLRRVGVMAA